MMPFDKMSWLEIWDNIAAELAHEGQITNFKKEDHIKLSKKII